MDHYSEKLNSLVSDLVAQARYAERLLNRVKALTPDQASRFSVALAEIALLSFAAGEELDRKGTAADRIRKQELSSALWQIGLRCLDIRDGTDLSLMRARFHSIGLNCGILLSLLGLPEPEWDEAIVPRPIGELSIANEKETGLRKTEPPGELVFSDGEPGPEKETLFLTLLEEPQEDDLIRKLKREIGQLREILTSLVLKQDHLLLVESRELTAIYMRELGSLEAEVYHETYRARYLQRKFELIQAAVNRQEEIRIEEIDRKLEGDYEAWQRVYVEFVRKGKEAEKDAKRREDNVKNSSRGDSEGNGPEDGLRRMKKLYRKIVKAMHPDLHPDQDERTKQLFKRAIRAYEVGDLRTLEEISQIMGGGEAQEPEGKEALLSKLLKEKQQLLELIQETRGKISRILSEFPFTMKSLLNDPVLLEAEKEKLKQRLEQARQRAEAYRSKIEEIERNGRSDR